MTILFIDCCIRKAASRTLTLCNVFLAEVSRRHPEVTVCSLPLGEAGIAAMDRDRLDHRDRLIGEKRLSDAEFDYAREFAAADYILIGAPYWDLSFPACLKNYIEQVSVNGIVFTYVEAGSLGLCKAQKMMYISTAGGFVPEGGHAGEAYMRQLSSFYGIGEFASYCLEGLDIFGIDVQKKMEQAEAAVREMAGRWIQ